VRFVVSRARSGAEGGDTIREGQNFDQNRPLPEISDRVHGTAGYPLPVGFIVMWRIVVRRLVVVGLVGRVWRLSGRFSGALRTDLPNRSF